MGLRQTQRPTESQEMAAEHALRLATQYALSTVKEDGHWLGPMSSDVTITAEWIFLLQSIGRAISEEDRAAYRYHFLSSQQGDGSWPIAPQYPHGGNLSATIEAYLALKILGLEPDHTAMRKARDFVLAHGGMEEMRIFTRFHLAMFGLLPWSTVPQMPPELMLLPSWFPVNIYKFSSWARITIVPFLVIRTREPVYALPNGRHGNNNYLDELWCDPNKKSVSYSKSAFDLWSTDKIAFLFQMADLLIWLFVFIGLIPFRNWAIRFCISWILERQEESGDWAGIFPPMHLSIYALLLEGYELDDDPVQRGLEALDRFCYQDAQRGKWMQPCVSPVWDTFLMVRGLCDSNVIDKNDELLTRGLSWTRARQLFVKHGDWRVYRPQLIAGGFSFEYVNTWYPDVDDTAAGILAFLKQDPSSLYSAHVLRAAVWILGMQNRDGGWAAFDVGNDALFLNSIPFSDMDSLCDPSSADIVGRVIEAFGLMLQLFAQSKLKEHEDVFQAIATSCFRAIGYLQRTQEPTGSWYGRWGTNYIYGTSNVLCGLSYFSAQPRVRAMSAQAVQWLVSVQNADGGWGERLDSYTHPERAGVGESTPSQTAWALMGLLPYTLPESDAVTRGVTWLITAQIDQGKHGEATWSEAVYTGTGFPGHFYLGYDLYKHYFPMMALGRYVEHTKIQCDIKS
ncbi:putative squalene-hopene-cyclase [Hypoxylon crocopeplum]|nr:putative squalene-hopene-cyclase [Hypoxylon crocopeplum]